MNISLKVHDLGFLQIDPLPTPAELTEFYEKLYYQDSKSSTYQHSYSSEELQYINNKIAQKANILFKKTKSPGRLLDVGCGEGFVLAYFLKFGWSVYGIDYSDFGINNLNPDLAANFEKGDIYTIIDKKIKDGEKFEILWLGNVLEHVPDPIGLLINLKKLLQDDGNLVITVPNDGSKYQDLLLNEGFVNRKWWVAYPDHLSYFNNESLKSICEFAGYNVCELLGDFPIDFFLLHSGSNYINDTSKGKLAHQARVRMENFISNNGIDDANQFFSSLAKVGLGRDLTIFLTL